MDLLPPTVPSHSSNYDNSDNTRRGNYEQWNDEGMRRSPQGMHLPHGNTPYEMTSPTPFATGTPSATHMMDDCSMVEKRSTCMTEKPCGLNTSSVNALKMGITDDAAKYNNNRGSSGISNFPGQKSTTPHHACTTPQHGGWDTTTKNNLTPPMQVPRGSSESLSTSSTAGGKEYISQPVQSTTSTTSSTTVPNRNSTLSHQHNNYNHGNGKNDVLRDSSSQPMYINKSMSATTLSATTQGPGPPLAAVTSSTRAGSTSAYSMSAASSGYTCTSMSAGNDGTGLSEIYAQGTDGDNQSIQTLPSASSESQQNAHKKDLTIDPSKRRASAPDACGVSTDTFDHHRPSLLPQNLEIGPERALIQRQQQQQVEPKTATTLTAAGVPESAPFTPAMRAPVTAARSPTTNYDNERRFHHQEVPQSNIYNPPDKPEMNPPITLCNNNPKERRSPPPVTKREILMTRNIVTSSFGDTHSSTNSSPSTLPNSTQSSSNKNPSSLESTMPSRGGDNSSSMLYNHIHDESKNRLLYQSLAGAQSSPSCDQPAPQQQQQQQHAPHTYPCSVTGEKNYGPSEPGHVQQQVVTPHAAALPTKVCESPPQGVRNVTPQRSPQQRPSSYDTACVQDSSRDKNVAANQQHTHQQHQQQSPAQRLSPNIGPHSSPHQGDNQESPQRSYPSAASKQGSTPLNHQTAPLLSGSNATTPTILAQNNPTSTPMNYPQTTTPTTQRSSSSTAQGKSSMFHRPSSPTPQGPSPRTVDTPLNRQTRSSGGTSQISPPQRPSPSTPATASAPSTQVGNTQRSSPSGAHRAPLNRESLPNQQESGHQSSSSTAQNPGPMHHQSGHPPNQRESLTSLRPSPILAQGSPQNSLVGESLLPSTQKSFSSTAQGTSLIRESSPLQQSPHQRPSPSIAQQSPLTRQSAPALQSPQQRPSPSIAQQSPLTRQSAPAQQSPQHRPSPSIAQQSPLTRQSAPAQPSPQHRPSPSIAQESLLARQSAPAQQRQSPSIAQQSPLTRQSAPPLQSPQQRPSPSIAQQSPLTRQNAPAQPSPQRRPSPSVDQQSPITRQSEPPQQSPIHLQTSPAPSRQQKQASETSSTGAGSIQSQEAASSSINQGTPGRETAQHLPQHQDRERLEQQQQQRQQHQAPQSSPSEAGHAPDLLEKSFLKQVPGHTQAAGPPPHMGSTETTTTGATTRTPSKQQQQQQQHQYGRPENTTHDVQLNQTAQTQYQQQSPAPAPGRRASIDSGALPGQKFDAYADTTQAHPNSHATRRSCPNLSLENYKETTTSRTTATTTSTTPPQQPRGHSSPRTQQLRASSEQLRDHMQLSLMSPQPSTSTSSGHASPDVAGDKDVDEYREKSHKLLPGQMPCVSTALMPSMKKEKLNTLTSASGGDQPQKQRDSHLPTLREDHAMVGGDDINLNNKNIRRASCGASLSKDEGPDDQALIYCGMVTEQRRGTFPMVAPRDGEYPDFNVSRTRRASGVMKRKSEDPFNDTKARRGIMTSGTCPTPQVTPHHAAPNLGRNARRNSDGLQRHATSRIDPEQIPRPSTLSLDAVKEPGGKSFDTDKYTSPPNPHTVCRMMDKGSCTARFIRMTMNQIPAYSATVNLSHVLVGAVTQPFAEPEPREHSVPLIDRGEEGPMRCPRCNCYANAFFQWTRAGREAVCNMCNHYMAVPKEHQCSLNENGQRKDRGDKMEFTRGSVDYVAPKEYSDFEPTAPALLYLIDCSQPAVASMFFQHALWAVDKLLKFLPSKETEICLATFDSSIQFYRFSTSKTTKKQVEMIVCSDLEEPFCPISPESVFFNPSKDEIKAEHFRDLLAKLPTIYQSTREGKHCGNAAMKACIDLMGARGGGQILYFGASLPQVGVGALAHRDDMPMYSSSPRRQAEAEKILNPQHAALLNSWAEKCNETHVAVDVFLASGANQYADVASMGHVARKTGGKVHYYRHFNPELDAEQFGYDVARTVVPKTTAYGCVYRIRCSLGLSIDEAYAPFDIDDHTAHIAKMSPDTTLSFTFRHDDQLESFKNAYVQIACLHTNVDGQRLIRVHTLILQTTSSLSNTFKYTCIDTLTNILMKRVARDVLKNNYEWNKKLQKECINILHSYRVHCATSTQHGQLILPESLKMLPLFVSNIFKTACFREKSSAVRIDQRMTELFTCLSAPVSFSQAWIYPRIYAVHNLSDKIGTPTGVADNVFLPPKIAATCDKVTAEGAYLVENGWNIWFFIGAEVSNVFLKEVFDIHDISGLQLEDFVLEPEEGYLSARIYAIVQQIRKNKGSHPWMSLRIVLPNTTEESRFFRLLCEDRYGGELSYVDYLCKIHKFVQEKLD